MASSAFNVLCRYRYDAQDRLAASTPNAQADVLRFYQKNRLATEIQGALHRSVFAHEDLPLAQQQRRDCTSDAILLATDPQGSVLQLMEKTATEALAYTAYGHHPADSGLASLLGFNGEPRDPVTGHYLLGNGYRAFNPVLMRFNSPDSLSPFGEGGLNAYAYCQGDPVNSKDPTGHAKFWNMTPVRRYEKVPIGVDLRYVPSGLDLTKHAANSAVPVITSPAAASTPAIPAIASPSATANSTLAKASVSGGNVSISSHGGAGSSSAFRGVQTDVGAPLDRTGELEALRISYLTAARKVTAFKIQNRGKVSSGLTTLRIDHLEKEIAYRSLNEKSGSFFNFRSESNAKYKNRKFLAKAKRDLDRLRSPT